LDAHSAEILKGGVDKTYIALTKGDFQQSQGVIDAPIARQEGSIITRCVSPIGQKSKTRYELIKQNRDVALVRIKLDTGRTHQIRVHFSYIGHPLLGDDLYGGDTSIIKRHALHCQSLEFISPDTKAVVSLSSHLPSDMQNLATRIQGVSTKGYNIV
ncbi:MAG: RluA family pseudouridine synthase, partial [Oscillospiraceae bacterium]